MVIPARPFVSADCAFGVKFVCVVAGDSPAKTLRSKSKEVKTKAAGEVARDYANLVN